MIVQSYASPKTDHSTETIHYAILDPGFLHLRYTVDCLGMLSSTLEQPNDSWVMVKQHRLDENGDDLVNVVNGLIKKYVINISRISGSLGFQVEGEGLICCRNFKRLIETSLVNREQIDLSGLGIDCLPPHIGLFEGVKKVILARNNLRVLPQQLKSLGQLKLIDLTGNPMERLPLPTWFDCWTKEKSITILMTPQEISDSENKTQMRLSIDESTDESTEEDESENGFSFAPPSKRSKWEDRVSFLDDKEQVCVNS